MKNQTNNSIKYKFYSINHINKLNCDCGINKIIVKFKYFYEYVFFKRYGEKMYSLYHYNIDGKLYSNLIYEEETFKEFKCKFDNIKLIGIIITPKDNCAVVEIVLNSTQLDIIKGIYEGQYNLKFSANISDNSIDDDARRILKLTYNKNASSDIILLLLFLSLLVGLVVLIYNWINKKDILELLLLYIAFVAIITFGVIKFKIETRSRNKK